MSFQRYSMPKNNLTLKSGPEVTQGHRNRHGSIRHLWLPINVTLHSNHGPISCCFRDKRRLQSKIANCSHPLCILRPRWSGSLWNWVSALGSKTRMIGLPGRERTLTISSAVWIQYTNVTDRRMDTWRQQRPRLRIASRGKNGDRTPLCRTPL